jgi:hypothetical protein
MNTDELKSKIARYQAVLDKTTDEREKAVIQSAIDKLKAQLSESGKSPAKPAEPVKKKVTPKKVESKAPAQPKKEKVKVVPKAKKGKPAEKPAKKVIPAKGKKKAVKEVEPKKVEKTVKVQKVIPDDEKKNVRDILEKEHYKVTFKEIGGKKVKVTVRHSDRTVAKNKIASAFNTIGKKVNSEDEKKQYAKDLQLLDLIQKTMEAIIEKIYKAFNAHNEKELSQIARKIKSI